VNNNNNNNNNSIHVYLRANLTARRPIIIIQFNSFLYYLCAVSTAVRAITDTAQCTLNNNNNNNNNRSKE
jgi:hypothetical protein